MSLSRALIGAAYAWMAMVGDVDLSGVGVDYVDAVHFGDAGQAVVADAVVDLLRAVVAVGREREAA